MRSFGIDSANQIPQESWPASKRLMEFESNHVVEDVIVITNLGSGHAYVPLSMAELRIRSEAEMVGLGLAAGRLRS